MEDQNPVPDPDKKQTETKEDQTAAREEKRPHILDPEYACSTRQDLIDLLGTLDAMRDPA